MRIVSVDLKRYSVGFAPIPAASRGGLSFREGIMVRVALSDGTLGFGEIAPLENYSAESIDDAGRSAEQSADALVGIELPVDFEALADLTESRMGGNYPPSVVFGVETALADAAAKSSCLPLCRWIDRGSVAQVPVNAVLSGDRSAIEAQLEHLSGMGFGAFKVKVGILSADGDVETVRFLRNHLGSEVTIRLDANGAWRFHQAAAVLTRLGDQRIEFVEEPLVPSEMHMVDDLHSITGIKFALDESVRDFLSWERLVEADAVTAVIVKPTLVGGIGRARKLCYRAFELGKKAVITSTLECGVGVASCLHLAASLAGKTAPCGLDTLRFLANTLIREQLPVVGGSIRVTDAPGLGVTPAPGVLD